MEAIEGIVVGHPEPRSADGEQRSCSRLVVGCLEPLLIIKGTSPDHLIRNRQAAALYGGVRCG